MENKKMENKKMSCPCGKTFPYTRNGYSQYKEHLRDILEDVTSFNSHMPISPDLRKVSDIAMGIAMRLFEEHYGNDTELVEE